jgi:aminopeptidase-like protein
VLATKIFPICRSITGNGVRQTLSQIGAHVALETYEVPTGTKVFDWTIPREWNIRDTYINDSRGGTFTRCRDNSTLPYPLSHLVLCLELGILHAPSSIRTTP